MGGGSGLTRPAGVARHEIRIIAGTWRSRRLRFPAVEGLRPTPDRVRETLFNWLRDAIEGARCLDLFAGSGALGFEAASRGAARVVQVDASARVCSSLRQHCARLAADSVQVVEAQARQFLLGVAEPFDVVFLDPPFRRGWLAPLCESLERCDWLAPEALIYLEFERELGLDGLLPPTWSGWRHGTAGEVGYALYQRRPAA